MEYSVKKKIIKVHIDPHVEKCMEHLFNQQILCTSRSSFVNSLLTDAILLAHARGKVPADLLGAAGAFVAPSARNLSSTPREGAGVAHSASCTAEVPAAQSERGYGRECDAW